MYIEPNTTIELFKNVHLDSDYNNTMWFANVTAQNTFFNGLTSIQFTAQSYQRKDRGVIRLNATIASVFDCNYMRFKNSSFENKWYYAFVTAVEYVNNNACNIHYMLDIIQSYFFDFELHSCLVERQHSTTDVAGDNLEIEGLEIGDAICTGQAQEYGLSPASQTAWSAVICCAYTEDTASILSGGHRGYICGQVNGLYLKSYDLNGHLNDFLEALDDLAQYTESVVCIYMMPTNLISTNTTHHIDLITVTKPATIDGYTPINKKLLTFPYCYLHVYNDQNQAIDFHYDKFYNTSGDDCHFSAHTVTSCSPESILIPNYDGQAQNIMYSLSASGFPQIGFSTNAYKAWYAMNYDSLEFSRDVSVDQAELSYQSAHISNNQAITQGIITAVSGAGMILTGSKNKSVETMIGGATSIGMGITDAIYAGQKNDIASAQKELDIHKATQGANIQESVARRLPNSPHTGSSNGMSAIHEKGFYFQPMCIRRQFAEKVDKFFTMFGYAQNKVMTPNLHTRAEFTYIKTSGCSVTGNMPQDDKEAINMIFDKGIRFWVNYSNIENYNVTNTILS